MRRAGDCMGLFGTRRRWWNIASEERRGASRFPPFPSEPQEGLVFCARPLLELYSRSPSLRSVENAGSLARSHARRARRPCPFLRFRPPLSRGRFEDQRPEKRPEAAATKCVLSPLEGEEKSPAEPRFFGNKKGETTSGPFVHALWLHGCGAEERKGERAAGWTDGLRGTTRFRGLPLQPAAKRASVQRPPLSGSGKLGDEGWIRVYVRVRRAHARIRSWRRK